MSDSTQQGTREEEIDLGRAFGILIDHKWLIASVTALFTLGGVAYGMLATPIYEGDALVQVERRSTVSPLGDLREVFGENSELNTLAEVQILRSRMVLGRVADRLGRDTVIEPVTLPLVGNYIVRHGIERPKFPLVIPYIGDYVLRSGIPQPEFMDRLPYVWGDDRIEISRFEIAESWHGQHIVIERDIGNQYQVLINDQVAGIGNLGEAMSFLDGDLVLRVEDFDAPPGVQFNLIRRHRSNAIRAIANRLEVTEVGGRGTSTGMLRLTMSGPDPDEILATLDAVADTFLTQNVERQSAEAEQSLAFLKDQVPELRSQLTVAEQRLSSYRMELDSVDLSEEAQATVQRFIDIEGKLNDLEFQRAELAQRFTPKHPNYQTLLRQRSHLEAEREALNAQVNELPAAQQEVIRLNRDVEVTQAIYVSVLNKMQELQVAKAGTIGNVRIIDRAQLSGLVAPKKPLITALATLLGLIFSVGGVMLRSLLRQGVESPDEIEAVGVPVYATIPLSSQQRQLARLVRKRRGHPGQPIMASILADRNPSDIAVEAIRGLRTSLHFAMLEGRNNCLMITGPSPNVGKSFVSVNLCAVAAKADMRVLLIDADLRNGHLHRAFDSPCAKGLADFLSGQASLDEIMQPTSIDNAWLITRGSVPPNPSELLMQPRFGDALQQLSERFDLVIIDTPPVLSVTDASVVGHHCDTTLMVVRFEANPVREIVAARRRLESNGLDVQGAILNAMEYKAATAYGKYGYYFYQYR
ncbi:polysaccharide biosynthesis tyrosine autokinase [Billgrantia azerbaijanica]|nr:polysaccharide biosynthesis tyrosine autokinase [Halomonas azerbaijanica]